MSNGKATTKVPVLPQLSALTAVCHLNQPMQYVWSQTPEVVEGFKEDF